MEKHFLNRTVKITMSEHTNEIHLGTKLYSNGNNNEFAQTRNLVIENKEL